jgi:hypothetical protein
MSVWLGMIERKRERERDYPFPSREIIGSLSRFSETQSYLEWLNCSGRSSQSLPNNTSKDLPTKIQGPSKTTTKDNVFRKVGLLYSYFFLVYFAEVLLHPVNKRLVSIPKQDVWEKINAKMMINRESKIQEMQCCWRHRIMFNFSVREGNLCQAFFLSFVKESARGVPSQILRSMNWIRLACFASTQQEKRRTVLSSSLFGRSPFVG